MTSAKQGFVNLQQPATGDAPFVPNGLGEWLATSLGWRSVAITGAARPSGAGSANETLLVDVDHRGGHERLAVRLAGGTVTPYHDTDLVRQARTVAWVGEHTTVPVPEVLGVETSADVLGRPFMVMRRIDGVAAPDYPGYNIDGFIRDADAETRHGLWASALDTMGALHVADSSSIDFLPGSAGDGLAALVASWQDTAAWAAERCDVDRLAEVLDLLAGCVPAGARRGLSWGDARVANMLFRAGRCVAVLDWEMASLGGPLVDLAWWLMFDLIQSVDLGVERLDGLGDRAATIDRWQQRTGLEVTTLGWHEVFGHVQLALTRANVFAQRAGLGLPVPGPDDPRSVERLADRMEALLDAGALS